jgi:hypothetical protein
MNDVLIVVAVAFLIFSLIFLFAFFGSIRRRKFFGAVRNFTFSLLMLVLSLLFGVISFSIQGYNALTKEEETVSVEITPEGEQLFTAGITYPDGFQKKYKLKGDEFYIDAHILKWKYPVNLLGLHTLYEFDRIAGRYSDIEDEKTKERTVHSIAKDRLIDIFNLRLQYSFLSFLVDAEYGSASFAAADKPKKMNVLVSTSGLLIRQDEQ